MTVIETSRSDFICSKATVTQLGVAWLRYFPGQQLLLVAVWMFRTNVCYALAAPVTREDGSNSYPILILLASATWPLPSKFF
jgi:hypothetical protein